MLGRVLFTWIPCGCWGLQEPQSVGGIWLFSYVETCDEFPHGWYFPLACLWDIGASEYKQYSLASGDRGDDASDGKKKNHHIFKDSCFIWSCNSPEQCLTYSAPPCGPVHGIKRQAPLCCPGHWGSIAPPHCPWCRCEHLSLCSSLGYAGSQGSPRWCTLAELCLEGW